MGIPGFSDQAMLAIMFSSTVVMAVVVAFTYGPRD
jgi:hypothetical protein